MTTIAWDGKTLAADSQVTRADRRMPESLIKIISGNGYIGAVSGIFDKRAMEFLSWVQMPSKPDAAPPIPVNDNSCFILVRPDGSVSELDHQGAEILCHHWGYYAWGSGAAFAIGALAAGCNAVRAVEIACLHDIYSSGTVRSYTLGKSP